MSHLMKSGAPCGRPDNHKSRCVTPERLEEKRAWQRRWRERHPGHFAGYWQDIKREVLSHYGDCCACCGTTEDLSIDHAYGGGNAHRRKLGVSPGTQFYLWLRDNDYPAGYQVLCKSCNSSKNDGTGAS